MIRRIFGIAHVEDLEMIKDPDVRACCEKIALSFAKKLIKDGHVFSQITEATSLAANFYSGTI